MDCIVISLCRSCVFERADAGRCCVNTTAIHAEKRRLLQITTTHCTYGRWNGIAISRQITRVLGNQAIFGTETREDIFNCGSSLSWNYSNSLSRLYLFCFCFLRPFRVYYTRKEEVSETVERRGKEKYFKIFLKIRLSPSLTKLISYGFSFLCFLFRQWSKERNNIEGVRSFLSVKSSVKFPYTSIRLYIYIYLMFWRGGGFTLCGREEVECLGGRKIGHQVLLWAA